MSEMRIAQLKLRQVSFVIASHLVTHMEGYGYDKNEKDKSSLELCTMLSKGLGLPLPSGRWGNAIALALELNEYIAAEYLIKNAKRLGLETSTVVSELGFKNPWTLKEEYLYSLLTFDEPLSPKGEHIDDEHCTGLVKAYEREKAACKRIEKMLSITKEDKKVLRRVK